MSVQIGTASADRGKKASGILTVSKSTASLPIGIPITIVNGTKPGPTFVANAAMHGTEIIGTPALSRLFKSLNPENLSGTFIGVPILSTWAVEAEHRLPTTFDHFDIEQLFPGDPDGTITERIAAAFIDQIASRADYIVDLHGQDQYWQPTRAIIVPTPKPSGNIEYGLYEKCLELARAFGVEQVWRLKKPGNLTEVLMKQRGIPSISTEYGGLTEFRSTDRFVEEIISGLENIMIHIGMLTRRPRASPPDEPAKKEARRVPICDLHAVRNRHGGTWTTQSMVGDKVKQGDIVGTVSDPITGETLEEIHAPFEGILALVWCLPVIRPAVTAIGIGVEAGLL